MTTANITGGLDAIWEKRNQQKSSYQKKVTACSRFLLRVFFFKVTKIAIRKDNSLFQLMISLFFPLDASDNQPSDNLCFNNTATNKLPHPLSLEKESSST